ncbi:hypothetical protein LguiA_015200 [Lonicera macranthoides]
MPPGPWKLPLIGNILQLAGSVPHRALRDLAKKHGPLMHLQLGEISMIVISSPRLAKELMKTHDLAFADRPALLVAKIVMYNATDIASAPYGAYWRQLRKITTLKLLSAKKVRSFRSIREEEVSNLVQSVRLSSTGSLVNLSQEIYTLTYKIVCKAAFGGNCKYGDDLKLLMNEIVSSASGFDVADLFPSLKLLHIISGTEPKFAKLHQKVNHVLDNIIEEHNVNLASAGKDGNNDDTEEEDLLDVLLKIPESEGLDFPITSDNIKAVIMDMFIAGTDTSSNVMEWAMSEMIKNPRVMDKAQAELRQVLKGKDVIHESDIQDLIYLKMVIKETLRLHTPVPLLLPRECREQCKIDGYDIPMKTKVIVNAWAIGRDPEYWDDGESFLPERFENSSIDIVGSNYEYMPFGAGRRMCPGATFGLANIELPLAQLLYHFDWKLPHGMKPGDLDMSESFGAVVRKKDELYLIATPHAEPQPA